MMMVKRKKFNVSGGERVGLVLKTITLISLASKQKGRNI